MKDNPYHMADDWKACITQYIALYASAAYEGYKAHGRGLVFVNLRQPSLCEFLTADDPRTTERGGWPIAELSEMIASYEPESEFVLLAILPDGGASARKMGPLDMKAVHDRGIINVAIHNRKADPIERLAPRRYLLPKGFFNKTDKKEN